MSGNLETLFGSAILKNKAGEIVNLQTLEGKVVGIYFSAHWCGPCRHFTPELVEKYTSIIADGHAFEVIFVSSDQDEAAFGEYYAEMPWAYLEFSDRDKKEFLSEYFEVEGIPTLVLLNGKGETLSKEGRELILSAPFDKLEEFETKRAEAAEWEERERMIVETESRMLRDEFITALPATIKSSHHTETLIKVTDLEESYTCGVCKKDGSNFAYRHAESNFNAHPRCCLEKDSAEPAFNFLGALLDGATLKNRQGKVVSVESLKGKTVGLYVSAHWCGPCRSFTPVLAAKYEEINSADSSRPLEVIFLSLDQTAEDQAKYFAEMPWIEADFVYEKSRVQFITQLLRVRGLPTLLLFDEHGGFITNDGRTALFTTSLSELASFESNKRAAEAVEEARILTLPAELTIPALHAHPLVRTRCMYGGHGQFGCDVCSSGGSGWAYHCDECNFDAHIECALKTHSEVSTTEEVDEPAAASEEVVCEGDVCTLKSR